MKEYAGKSKAKKKRRKRTPYAIQKDKTWAVFSRYIRMREANLATDGYNSCITCGLYLPWEELQAGHFIDGRTNAILFDDRGVHAQCKGCNVFKHGNKVEYYVFMKKMYGEEVIEDLRRLGKTTIKYTIDDLKMLEEKFADKIKELLYG